MSSERSWVWAQPIPPEEKLMLLALIEVGDDPPDAKGKLPGRIEEAARLCGFGGHGGREISLRLHTRGLIEERGGVRAPE